MVNNCPLFQFLSFFNTLDNLIQCAISSMCEKITVNTTVANKAGLRAAFNV